MRIINARQVSKMISLGLLEQALKSQTLGNMLFRLFQNEIKRSLAEKWRAAIYKERLIMLENLSMSIWKGYQEGRLSRRALMRLLEVFFNGVPVLLEKRKELLSKQDSIPLFITLSPTQVCNLKCKGCYAGSEASTRAQLSFEVSDRILREKKELWGSFFTVISGGEPLAYRDNGKTIYDLYEKHSDQFFLMYTNGTLIDKKVAKRLAELGNVTPAISVEGLEKETDDRRGKGVFKKILRAMENLREEGVLFGISMTATRENADILLSPEVINFWMDEQGAFYAWMFQYMPIGRAWSLDLLPTLEQRLRMYERTRELIHKERRFVVDFWNNGPLSRGCISAGRDFGYFYIDWNGNIMPCVFVPYYTHNINQLYAQGKTLADAHSSEYFQEIRAWQKDYGYQKPMKEVKNWLAPCPIRDNHGCFCQIREKANALPADQWADMAMEDEEYKVRLIEYGKQFKELSQPLWEKYYLATEIDREAV